MLMTDSVSWCASIVLLVQCSPTPSFISFNLDRVLENRGGGRDKMDKKVGCSESKGKAKRYKSDANFLYRTGSGEDPAGHKHR